MKNTVDKNRLKIKLVLACTFILCSVIFSGIAFGFDSEYANDTATMDIGVQSYQQITNDCTNAITLQTPDIAGSRHNPKAVEGPAPAQGYYYAYETCNIEVQHNDPDTNFNVTYAKSQPFNLGNSNGSYTYTNIDNAGGDCLVDTTGNTDDEEFGYRIENISLATGVDVQNDTECIGIAYNATSGSDEYVFDIEYSDQSDLIIQKSSGTAVCGPNDCTFDLKGVANVSWDTVPVPSSATPTDKYGYFNNGSSYPPFETSVLITVQP
jgi:hypothetical protein